jgi:hypothetical protein
MLKLGFRGATVLLALTPVMAAPIELKTATTHPLQYYLSLPEAWTTAKKWPVVVAIESANGSSRRMPLFLRGRGGRCRF